MARRKKEVPFSKVAGPTKAQQDSPLMALAAELRNKIYEEVFSDMRIELSGLKNEDENKPPTKLPGLLLACKQTHSEAIRIYWASADFGFEATRMQRLTKWSRFIGVERKALIRKFCFYKQLFGIRNRRIVRWRAPISSDWNVIYKSDFNVAQRFVDFAKKECGFQDGVARSIVRARVASRWYLSTEPMQEYQKLIELYQKAEKAGMYYDSRSKAIDDAIRATADYRQGA